MPTPLRFLLFFLLLLTVLAATNRHVFRWVVDAFHPPPWLRKALAWTLVSSLVLMFGGRILDFLAPDAPVRAVLTASSVVQLGVLMGSILLLAVDALLLFVAVKRWGPRLLDKLPWVNNAVSPPGVDARHVVRTNADESAQSADVALLPVAQIHLPRRSFLAQAAAGSAILVSGSSSLYGAISGRHDYEIQELEVRIPGLSPRFDGFTIAQLSDIHIGQFVGPHELAAAEDLVSRVKADLIVLTGDLVDHDVRRADELGRLVRRLTPLARHGVAAVTGNHDFYAGADAITAAIHAGGGRVLRNCAEVLGDSDAGIALVGVDDLFGSNEGRGPDLAKAIASLPVLGGRAAPAQDLPRVLLCHQPVFFRRSSEHVALQMSGHTHGGQVNLLVRPADWVLPNGWVAGKYEFNGSTLYINRGFGTAGPPARIGAPPEVTRLVLTS
jgi:uncharacterized protein